MAYDATSVLPTLWELQSAYHSALFLNGKTTGEEGVGEDCTRVIQKTERIQRKLLATGYPVPDEWLTRPCDIKVGPPDENRHCQAWVAVDAKVPTIIEQLRRAILRVQAETPTEDSATPTGNKNPGGRPPKWDKLWGVIQEQDRLTPKPEDKAIAKAYNQRFGSVVGQDPKKRATAAIVRQVRCSRRKQNHK